LTFSKNLKENKILYQISKLFFLFFFGFEMI
jgi:hypothetical protein